MDFHHIITQPKIFSLSLFLLFQVINSLFPCTLFRCSEWKRPRFTIICICFFPFICLIFLLFARFSVLPKEFFVWCEICAMLSCAQNAIWEHFVYFFPNSDCFQWRAIAGRTSLEKKTTINLVYVHEGIFSLSLSLFFQLKYSVKQSSASFPRSCATKTSSKMYCLHQLLMLFRIAAVYFALTTTKIITQPVQINKEAQVFKFPNVHVTLELLSVLLHIAAHRTTFIVLRAQRWRGKKFINKFQITNQISTFQNYKLKLKIRSWIPYSLRTWK